MVFSSEENVPEELFLKPLPAQSLWFSTYILIKVRPDIHSMSLFQRPYSESNLQHVTYSHKVFGRHHK
ncbi:hypothetical protein JTE90_004442 [Oedothorax gibbosus]|uniref:Uncharacterized protein n=1 Tax=Oedothorax gibbosus TaxID=931172 RepID=A0AAV6UNJ7_9ARAC|nr:hypothetical protein JTE90_004442 [Oedothorax gibbosus]